MGILRALIGAARRMLPMGAALIIHAIGAPLGFSAISFFYFRRFAYTTPLQTASVFLGVVVALDLFLVAPFKEKSFAMFASPLGTWIPFALIFTATYVTGRMAARGPSSSLKLPAQPVGRAPISPV